MNHQVDIVVIGDSKNGNAALKELASYKSALKIAFISRDFKSSTTRDFLNVEYIKDEVIFTDYKNRLFGCYLKNGDRVYCTHLIIATGLAYKSFMVNNKKVPNVFNKVEELPKRSKDLPAVILGHDNEAVKLALKVAKKFKHAYLCTEQFTFENVTASNLKKIDETENLVVLHNASVIKVCLKENELKAVELSNYSTLTCSAIFVKTESAPESKFVPNKLINKNSLGFFETNSNAESSIVPKCFAIGTCNAKHTNKKQQQMLETIKADF